MAIAILTSNESGANSLIDINANFADLDTTKADLASPTFTGSPVLPTGTTGVTQSASDNSTKLATTAYVDSAVPTTPTAVSLIPPSAIFPIQNSAPSNTSLSSNTTMYIGQVVIPFKITANKISIVNINNAGTDGTLDITMYSESGQTQIFSVTTASITASANVLTTTALSSVVINPGIYYIGINTNGTANISTYFYTTTNTVYSQAGLNVGLPGAVTSEPIMQGTLVITAGTPPATITPGSITWADNTTLIFRLDN